LIYFNIVLYLFQHRNMKGTFLFYTDFDVFVGSLGLDIGVGEAGGSGDERGASEEEAGRGGTLPHHLA
jgi:hypothetical protein